MTNEAVAVGEASLHYVGSRSKRDGASPYLGSTRKRLLDITGSLFLIGLLAALMLMTAIAIRLETRGPSIFVQRRNGLRRKEIRVLKFRSMRHSPADPFVQAIRGDCRVTGVGRFIRRTSIDELPQLFNVLSGEMSLVGPRPHPLPLDERFRNLIDQYDDRHLAVPGITGLAQISGARGETSDVKAMQRRVDYDIQYIQDASLGLDILILLRTARELFLNNSRAEVF